MQNKYIAPTAVVVIAAIAVMWGYGSARTKDFFYGMMPSKTPAATTQVVDTNAPPTIGQQRMDGNLVTAFKERRNEAVKTKEMVAVTIRGEVTDELQEALTNSGGEIQQVAEDQQSLTARVPLTNLEAIALFPGVTFVEATQ